MGTRAKILFEKFVRKFTRKYVRKFTRKIVRKFTRKFVRKFTRKFVRKFTRKFVRKFTRKFVRKFTKNLSKKLFEHLSENLLENVSENLLENLSKKLFEHLSEHVSENFIRYNNTFWRIIGSPRHAGLPDFPQFNKCGIYYKWPKIIPNCNKIKQMIKNIPKFSIPRPYKMYQNWVWKYCICSPAWHRDLW
jgi:hypothetical protein